MRIAVASGKGGTGKTTLSVNLAVALAGHGPVGLLDCDVEEPDCHLYLRPAEVKTTPVSVPIPQIDPQYCTSCGLCAHACEFHALVALPGLPLLLPELCHGCGVCNYVCPEEAITDGRRQIGNVESCRVGDILFRWGSLNIGEARSTPVIRAVKDLDGEAPPETIIFDAPPGVACPAVETMRGADFVILVTEPTPFGLNDLRLALETVRSLGLPHGVVVNRAGLGNREVYDHCRSAGVPILLEIPDDRRVAEACSQGEVFAAKDEDYAQAMRGLADTVRAAAPAPAAASARPAASADRPLRMEAS